MVVKRSVLPALLSLAVVALGGAALLWMGRDLICPCGTIRFWNGDVPSTESSQHIADWWTFSHVIHGFAFYLALRYAAPKAGMGWRLVAATALEVFWELIENSEYVIDRYRAVTVAIDYNGDSVLNSTADVAAMWLGFLLASRLPLPVSLGAVFVLEAVPMVVIRDGLLLNILMLVWPLESVLAWQGGG